MSKKRIAGLCVCGISLIVLIALILTNVIKPFDDMIYKMVTFRMNDTYTLINRVFTFLGSTPFIVGLVIFFFVLFLILKKNNYAYVVASVLIISTLVNNIIKWIINRPRPEVLRLVVEKSSSFPSGHTMASVSLYILLIYFLKKLKINRKLSICLSVILAILPVCVALSRIYLGAHYASDVIGGALVSTILLLIETYIINKKGWLK